MPLMNLRKRAHAGPAGSPTDAVGNADGDADGNESSDAPTADRERPEETGARRAAGRSLVEVIQPFVACTVLLFGVVTATVRAAASGLPYAVGVLLTALTLVVA